MNLIRQAILLDLYGRRNRGMACCRGRPIKGFPYLKLSLPPHPRPLPKLLFKRNREISMLRIPAGLGNFLDTQIRFQKQGPPVLQPDLLAVFKYAFPGELLKGFLERLRVSPEFSREPGDGIMMAQVGVQQCF